MKLMIAFTFVLYIIFNVWGAIGRNAAGLMNHPYDLSMLDRVIIKIDSWSHVDRLSPFITSQLANQAGNNSSPNEDFTKIETIRYAVVHDYTDTSGHQYFDYRNSAVLNMLSKMFEAKLLIIKTNNEISISEFWHYAMLISQYPRGTKENELSDEEIKGLYLAIMSIIRLKTDRDPYTKIYRIYQGESLEILANKLFEEADFIYQTQLLFNVIETNKEKIQKGKVLSGLINSDKDLNKKLHEIFQNYFKNNPKNVFDSTMNLRIYWLYYLSNICKTDVCRDELDTEFMAYIKELRNET